MRTILCEKCGIIKPTPPEDIALGITTRRIPGTVLACSIVCDHCNEPLSGKPAVAYSSPADMGNWEKDYFQPRICGACECLIDEHGCGCNPSDA